MTCKVCVPGAFRLSKPESCSCGDSAQVAKPGAEQVADICQLLDGFLRSQCRVIWGDDKQAMRIDISRSSWARGWQEVERESNGWFSGDEPIYPGDQLIWLSSVV